MTTKAQGLRQRLAAECERIEEDSTFNFMGHFAAGARWQSVDQHVGFPIALFSAIAAFCAFPRPDVATILSVATTLLAIVVLYFQPARRSSDHFRSGGKWKDLRQRARVFREITLLAPSLTEADLTKKMEDFVRERQIISELGVPIPDWAYQTAKKKIAAGQSSYKIDSPSQN